MKTRITIGVLTGMVLTVIAMSFTYLGPAQLSETKTGSKSTLIRADGSDEVARPEVGFPAPDFQLLDLKGKIVQLSELRGEPVFVNFWASWCPPCRQEMPDIQKVYTEQGRVVHFLAINLANTEKSMESVRQFLSDNGYSFPVLLDMDGKTADRYQVRAIPTSFFIDSEGIIRYKYLGAMNEEIIYAALKKV